MDLNTFLAEWHNDSPTLLVHTSGSTGQPKPMFVEKRRMEASARTTCDFLGLQAGDTALLCMSLDYIAGKMMVVRSLVRGLRLITVEPCGEPLRGLDSSLSTAGEELRIDFAAMVPLQVWNTLQHPEHRKRLMAVHHLIIGGGAIDDSLALELREFPNAVWSTYGMTETLSHIALRRLNGHEASNWYTPFEGVSLSLSDTSCLIIDAPAIHDGRLVTNDIAELLPDGRFRILGRSDNIICSGGIKIQAEEVERLLRTHLRKPFIITKRSDKKFGEIVVLLTEGSADEARQVCSRVLPRYWQPRDYIHTDTIPLTATGKPARRQAELLAHEPSR